MDGRPTWTDCDEAEDYVVPNVLSPRDLVFRPDNMDETVPHTLFRQVVAYCCMRAFCATFINKQPPVFSDFYFTRMDGCLKQV